MNIHLITYLTSKLFWIYTVFRYNTILYPKDEDTQKLFAYFCAYLLSCWGSMQWGTMYGDLIFELIALLIITVAYQADWQHHVWNTLMVYIMGILCDGIPIVFFQRYAVARNPVHHHMGPGTIVMGNFIFFLLEVIIERKVGVEMLRFALLPATMLTADLCLSSDRGRCCGSLLRRRRASAKCRHVGRASRLYCSLRSANCRQQCRRS